MPGPLVSGRPPLGLAEPVEGGQRGLDDGLFEVAHDEHDAPAVVGVRPAIQVPLRVGDGPDPGDHHPRRHVCQTSSATTWRDLPDRLAHVHADSEADGRTVATGYGSWEGFWSLIQRGISGVYHAVSPKYLQLYLNEYSFRYNHRDDAEPIFLQLAGRVPFRLPSDSLGS